MSQKINEEKQKMYIEAQLVHQNLKQHSEQMQKVEEKLGELAILLEALDGIKENTGKLLPTLGGGVFLNAEIKETENVYVNVGANIIVKKKTMDVKKMLSQQLEELEQYKMQIATQYEQLQHHMQHIQEKLSAE